MGIDLTENVVAPDAGAPVISARDVRVWYGTTRGAIRAVDGVMTTGSRRRRRSVGLMVSFSPSPTRVSPVISRMIASPGKSAGHQVPAWASSRARLRS